MIVSIGGHGACCIRDTLDLAPVVYGAGRAPYFTSAGALVASPSALHSPWTRHGPEISDFGARSSSYMHAMPATQFTRICLNGKALLCTVPIPFLRYILIDFNWRLFKAARWDVDPANMPSAYSFDRSPDELLRKRWVIRIREVHNRGLSCPNFMSGLQRISLSQLSR